MRSWLPFVGFVAAVIAATFVFSFAHDRWVEHRQHVTHGTAQYTLLVGDWFVLIDNVRIMSSRGDAANGWRIATVDASNGKLVADRVVPPGTKCWQATEARIWCRHDAAIELYGLPKLETVATAAQLLQSRGTPAGRMFKATDHDLTVVLNDGKAATIDSQTLAVTDADGTGINSEKLPPGKPWGTHHDLPVDGGYLQIQGSPAPKVVFNPHNYGSGTPIDGAPTFLGREGFPRFVRVRGTKDFALVQHKATLDPNGARRLSRLDVEPLSVKWTVPVNTDDVIIAALRGSTIVFGTEDENNRAFALDAQTGLQVWWFAFPN